MRCLIYAVGKFVREGGYLCIRRSRNIPIPHFLHATKIEGCTHMTAAGTSKGFLRELWETINGKGYELKKGDE